MEVANSAVKAALDNLLTLHKNAGSDTEFMSSGFEIIQTLLNNIHMAQSHMFASLIGCITKTQPVIQETATHPIPYTHNKDIDTYMSQFSNISISANKKNYCIRIMIIKQTPLLPGLYLHVIELIYHILRKKKKIQRLS